ncbi:MAG: 16S rRNA (adenine(1518)-N(6)/adenine(1519)-N(6))-dimethyltransferase RsmA [Flavobacteriales bacterium]|nr:16S rRNA (adenine(1518)-N(6)/adenine(1519)-N(6))-dimethyltransferase RsmA [Flavobacteriales bacterium]
MKVKPKKHLGQHFLKNDAICARISASLTRHGGYTRVLEIGPGTGALTKHLLERDDIDLAVVEIDRESINYLEQHYRQLLGRIVDQDFLKLNLDEISPEPFGVIGNFPYNISSQILFKVYDYRDQVPEVVGMFQREVAQRIASPPGSKAYGILSVLLQAYYDIEYLFTVDENEFIPPPKVKSAVIRLKRNETTKLDCDEKKFKQVIKLGFGMRRKTLRNSLKSLIEQYDVDKSQEIFNKRPEQLGVEEFVELTKMFS